MKLKFILERRGLMNEAGDGGDGGGGASPGVIGGANPGSSGGSGDGGDGGGGGGGGGENINPYEATFGQYFNPDGTAKEGWTEKLPQDLGLDDGRRARLGRQTSFDSLVKGLAAAQDQIEKRDGAGKFVPAEGDDLNRFRAENGIPVDLSNPEDSYDFTAGLEEGAVLAHPELANKIAPLLQEANVTKEQGRKIAEVFNTHQQAETQRVQAEMEKKEQEHMEAVIKEFKTKWGHEFDEKSRQVGKMHETYEFDVNDPRDLAALSNPKVVQALADLAVASRLGPVIPDAGGGGNAGAGAQSPAQQARTIMQENPNWRQDSALRSRVEMLHKQQAAMKKSG